VVERLGTTAEVRAAVGAARESGRRVGLVPTMGALHAGHAALIKRCRSRADLTIVSIFVNPTQFGPGEDFDRYPRALEEDLKVCENSGAAIVYVPSVQAMYPRGLASTFVEVAGLSDILEGASRPGHFRRVATVVLKLFEIVRPDLACFGQKDYQQQLVIKRMVEDLHVGVQIDVCPTIREEAGLAMSSRNRYLNAEERKAAGVLYQALLNARRAVEAGERDAARVRQILCQTIESEPLAKLDYAEIAGAEGLEPLVRLEQGSRCVALLAVRIGTTRLIDNMLLGVQAT
jgi:pantoate--beta-alanine ligase